MMAPIKPGDRVRAMRARDIELGLVRIDVRAHPADRHRIKRYARATLERRLARIAARKALTGTRPSTG